MFDGKRGGAGLERCDEILPEGVAACGVVRDFLHGVLGVVAVVHQAEVLPDDLFAGAGVEAGEVGVECAPSLDARGVFVAVGDAGATQRVRDDDLGFGADALALARDVFRGVDFEWLAGVGGVLPAGGEVGIGFAQGRNEGAASRMQLRECFVQGVRAIFCEQAVECCNLFADDFRRALVVVALGDCTCLADFFARKVLALRVTRCGDDIVLE